MKELLNHLRLMQLYAHMAHHVCKGPLFFQDHEFLGSLYAEVEGDYDAVAERAINKEGLSVVNLNSQLKSIYSKAKNLPDESKDDKTHLKKVLELEKELCSIIEKLVPNVSAGTEQLIGNVADKSEVRQYKLEQRLK